MRPETGDVSERSASLDVARALEEDIIFGRLLPGTLLVEDNLLARFGGTRHFIRQAIGQLEKTGIVVQEKNKSAMVRLMPLDEVEQIYTVRELLQRHAALMIRLPVSAELIDRLETINEQYSDCIDAEDIRGIHDANDDFHITLFGACGNKYLIDSIRHYMFLTLPIRAKTLSDRSRLLVSKEHHRMMIEMLQGHDNWVLAQLCVDHIQPSKLEYVERATVAAREAPSAKRPRGSEKRSRDFDHADDASLRRHPTS
jgi:DNA-binding GntR family transcriptional regulator